MRSTWKFPGPVTASWTRVRVPNRSTSPAPGVDGNRHGLRFVLSTRFQCRKKWPVAGSAHARADAFTPPLQASGTARFGQARGPSSPLVHGLGLGVWESLTGSTARHGRRRSCCGVPRALRTSFSSRGFSPRRARAARGGTARAALRHPRAPSRSSWSSSRRWSNSRRPGFDCRARTSPVRSPGAGTRRGS